MARTRGCEKSLNWRHRSSTWILQRKLGNRRWREYRAALFEGGPDPARGFPGGVGIRAGSAAVTAGVSRREVVSAGRSRGGRLDRAATAEPALDGAGAAAAGAGLLAGALTVAPAAARQAGCRRGRGADAVAGAVAAGRPTGAQRFALRACHEEQEHRE